MAGNGVRRGLIALVLLVAVVGAGVVLAGGALLQDGGDADGAPDDTTISQENRTVDTDRINVSVRLEPTDEMETEELQYELVVVGEIAAANDAANGTVDCTGELCVVDGTLAGNATDEDLPRYELSGVVTSASPESGYTANVTGTLEGDAIEGLGLGAYNVTAPNATGSTNDSVAATAEPLQTDGGTADPDVTDGSESESSEGEATESESSEGEATESESSESGATESESSESGATESESSEGEATESDDGTAENDESAAESPSVTFDGCSTATVEGDAYAYEAGLRYYVQSGLDTSTIDESEISTPTTIDGNELIGDARTTDVVVETVLVLDEDFGVVTQVSNPNYEDCVDEIEQQHADWEDQQGDV